MNIYTLLQIGEFHINHCEDFLITEPIGTNKQVIAVFDGCTMGRESVFASILYGKVIRNTARKFYNQSFIERSEWDPKSILKALFQETFTQLASLKNNLGLDTDELLSTAVVGIIDEEKRQGKFLTVGDGLIFHDGVSHEFEQEDKPDYLGYHLGEEFDSWYSKQTQFLEINEFQDLSICTDGIFTFKNLSRSNNQLSEQDIIDHFLVNNEHSENNNFLERKVRMLKDELDYVVTDDLAIVRIMLQ
ncbi:MAG: protein phosphatase 2C domain-containing protein [bacterium]|nr:protein phosphatase 2C domain-containing protein [bacterium]